MRVLGILGGTAAYHLDPAAFAPVRRVEDRVETPYGPVGPLVHLEVPGGTVLFLSRHGAGRLRRTARFVNAPALLYALKARGAQGVLSWNGVGAIDPLLEVGDALIPDRLIDWTRARSLPPEGIPPGPYFDPTLRTALATAARAALPRTFDGGVYACTEGPRLETRAEVEALARLGADAVGMTLVPEVYWARILGLPYASLCLVTNFATGRARGRPPLRRFGPEVGARAFRVLLRAAARLFGAPLPPEDREEGFRPRPPEGGRPSLLWIPDGEVPAPAGFAPHPGGETPWGPVGPGWVGPQGGVFPRDRFPADPRAVVAWAQALGAAGIVAVEGVRALNPLLRAGELLIPDDYLDRTRGRPTTFFEKEGKGYLPADPAFDPDLRSWLAATFPTAHRAGVYACVEPGDDPVPLASLGADVAGTRLLPEAFLARERDLAYAALLWVAEDVHGRRAGGPPAWVEGGPEPNR